MPKPPARTKMENIMLSKIFARTKRARAGCIEWQGPRSKQGYGQISIDRKTVYIHRYVYSRLVAEIPEDYFVCHKCDNPRCINPKHLFIGTPKDNAQDASRKGRLKRRVPWSLETRNRVDDMIDAGVKPYVIAVLLKLPVTRVYETVKARKAEAVS